MGQPEGFDELFRAEYPGIVRELALVLGDRALAEDVAADAFAELWRRWDKVKSLEKPGAWVRLVAVRGAGRARWRRGRRQQVEATHELGAPAEALDLDLLAALAALTQHQRVAVVLHHLGGWPAADIATVLGCAEVTVRTHLLRGRERLGALLAIPDDHQEVRDVDRG
jgi:RNA polymerase sigma-70 factor (ECF subfamily)